MSRAKVVGGTVPGKKAILCNRVHHKCEEFLADHRAKYGYNSAHIELTSGIVTMNFSHFPKHLKLMKWAREQHWYMDFIKQQKTSILDEDKYADALHKFVTENKII